jgi:hypothetical protein
MHNVDEDLGLRSQQLHVCNVGALWERSAFCLDWIAVSQ